MRPRTCDRARSAYTLAARTHSNARARRLACLHARTRTLCGTECEALEWRGAYARLYYNSPRHPRSVLRTEALLYAVYVEGWIFERTRLRAALPFRFGALVALACAFSWEQVLFLIRCLLLVLAVQYARAGIQATNMWLVCLALSGDVCS